MANGLFNLKQVIQAVQQGGWPAQKTPAVEYLVVAGGGGGGQNSGGAGAGGGLLQGIDPVPNGQTLLVTVGGGGAGGHGGSGDGVVGQNSVFGSITAFGGGYGGYNALPGGSGGSGGGGGAGSTSFANQTILSGQGTANQGNAGGLGLGGGAGGQAGGGGGAGTVGLNAPVANVAGNGGAGIASAISGTVTTYAGGGGGGTYPNTSVPGTGGVGGGGAGASVASAAGTNGSPNTGGGGGGGAGGGGIGGTGGSGIVTVSYPDVYAAATTVNATASSSGSGSIAFNGSSYLSTANNAALQPATGDFTIEAWVYPTTSANQMILMEARTSGGGVPWFFSLGTPTSTAPYFYDGATSFTASTLLPINTWSYVAVTRVGTALRVFINGAQEVNATCTTNLTGSSLQTIGGSQFSGTFALTGYVSNFRFIKGTGLYTSSFTPSIVPLTAITNTTLLLNTVSGAPLVDSSVSGFVQSVSGTTPTWNQASPFTGTGYKNRVYTWTTSGTITF